MKFTSYIQRINFPLLQDLLVFIMKRKNKSWLMMNQFWFLFLNSKIIYHQKSKQHSNSTLKLNHNMKNKNLKLN